MAQTGYIRSRNINLSAIFPLKSENIIGTQIPKEEEASFPDKLKIPILGIDTKIEPAGEDASGRMMSPTDPHNTSWWAKGTKLGENGSIVLAGHVNTPDSPFGIFYNLNYLTQGDYLYIQSREGQTFRYRVVGSGEFDEDNLPMKIIFQENDNRYLNLITCAGTFDNSKKTFTKRLVVYSVLDQ